MKNSHQYRKRGINAVLKRSIAMMLVIFMVMGILPLGIGTVTVHAETNTINPDYEWYGDGTSSNFNISSPSQLLGFANLVNGLDGKTASTFSGKAITLTTDVDLTGVNWLPIGYNENNYGPSPYGGPMFEGTFDGNNHLISGISVNIPGTDENVTTYGGFFGVASSESTIKNVILINPQISVTGGKGTDISTVGGGAYAGGIVGLTEATIENCHVIGGFVNVRCNDGGSSDVGSGGIAGRVGYGAVVRKSSSSADVSSMSINTTSGTYADQSKIPPSHIGGIVGDNRGTIENCTSSGNIVNNIPLGIYYAKALTGGIAGLNNTNDIKYCYFNGTVSGNPSNGPVGIGGIMGGNDYISIGSTSDCYYNKDKVTNVTQLQGTGLTEDELKDRGKFSGWDFTDVWEMGDDYPILRGSMYLPIDECKCEIGGFSVAGHDNIIIPYGENSATFTLEPTIPEIDSTNCTIPGHDTSRDIKFTYIIKSADSSLENGIICDGASIDPETKVITFTKAGTYTVEVYAGDPLSQKMQKATASFTVKNEGCTCVIPDFTFLNGSVKIPYNTGASSYTFINPSLTLTGDCQIDGHKETSIEYLYSVVEHDEGITSASIEENTLKVEGEGKVTVRLIASAPGTGAIAVSKDAEINFTKDECECTINDFTFGGGNITLPLGQTKAEKTFNDPSVTYEACDAEGHANNSIQFQYSIVPENNTAGASITDKTLTVTKNGSVTVKIRASVPGTDAVLEKTATFNVVANNIQIPEHLKNIKTIAGNSATLGWDANFTGSLDIEIKNSHGEAVKKDTVNIADRKYTVPAEVLTEIGIYTAELKMAGTSTLLTAQIEVLLPKTSVLFNPAKNTYYDNQSSVSLSWRTSNDTEGTTKKVTVKKGTTEYSNFNVQGDTVTIKNVQKPESSKDTYTVSVAISYGGKVVASDSFSFDVYKTNSLQIVNSLGESYSLASPLLISNVNAAQSMTQSELLEKAKGFNLQRSVKLKEAYSSYGEDKYQWTVADTKIASISGSSYADGYYHSNAEIKITGLKEGETTVTVKHVPTGASTEFKVKVETLEGKLYILKAPVNTSVNLQYKVGDATKNITTNANGMAAIFERNPLSGDIVVSGEASGKVYIGKTPVSQLVSGEISIGNATYPVSNINAAAASNITIKLSAAAKETVFQFMDNQIIQNGKLIKDVNLVVKGYLLKNDKVVDTKTQEVKINRTDYQNVTLQFDTSGLGIVNPSDKVKFVYEITGDENSPYAPAYASVEPTSGTTNFGEVPVVLQAAQKNQTAYINSIVMSDSLNGSFEDITNRTDSLNLNEKAPIKYVKAVICWPKNQIGTVDLVNSNGDVVGSSSLTRINSTIADMNYGWQEAIIKVDEKLIAKGKSLKFSYKLYNTVAQKSVQIPSNFVLANMTGVKSYDKQSKIPFLGIISTGETKMSILGNRGFEVPLPKDLGVSWKYEFNEDPLNGRFVVILGWGGEDLTNKEKDPEFDEAFKKAADMVKNKTKVKNSGGNLNVNVGGFMMGDIKYLNEQWTLVVTGGGMYGGVEGGYSFSQTQFVGPIPVCYGVEFKAGVELTAAFEKSRIAGSVNGSNFNQMIDVYLKLYGNIMAYGGVGIDIGFVAARIGLFGQLGLEYYFRSSFIENARRNGGQLKIEGSMGIEAVLRFLFFKKRYVLCEAGFEKKFAPNGFDFSKHGGFGAPTLRSMRFVQQVEGVDGKLYDLYESDYMIDDREYLSQPQLWNDGSKARATYSMVSLSEEAPRIIGINQYPYGYPMVSNDGEIMAIISDFGSEDVNDTGAAYSIKTGEGNWSIPVRIYDQKTHASNLTFDGTSKFAGAAWESTENSVSADNNDEGMSTVDISTALSKSEIYAAIYDGISWTTKKITTNNEADMAPAISVNNGHAVLLWQRVTPSADNPMNITAKNELWYSVFDRRNWSEEKILDSGDIGNIKSFSAAVATDGSAMAVANVDVDGDDATIKDREVFTYYISKDGTVARKNLTNNDWQDGASRVTARKINTGSGEKEYFFTAWYSEQVDENNVLLSNDIKLSVCTLDGEKVDGFPSSLGNGTGNFNFIKSDNTSLNSFGIVWSQVSGTAGLASQTLYARMLTLGDKGSIVVTSSYDLTSVNPDYEEIAKFDAVSKVDGNDINVEAVYLKNNIELANEKGTDLEVLKATSADLMSASRVITEGIDIGNVEYDTTGIQGGAILPLTIPVHNNGLSKVNSLKVKAKDQEYTIAKSILPDETIDVTIDYKVDEAISDVSMEVTPIYENGALGEKATADVKLRKPDLSIKSVVLSGTGDEGKRVFDVNLSNEGIKSIAENGYRVQIRIYEDFARREGAVIEDLSSGEKITNGRIIISDVEKLKDIDDKKGVCKIGYTILPNAYDESGNKTLYIDVDIIDSNGLIVDEASYWDNQSGISFTSPKLVYPSQFEATVIQENKDGVTCADITVRNLYQEAGQDTLRLRLLNGNQVVEEKNIPVNLNPESSMRDTIAFTKRGTGIQTAFIGDVKPDPTKPDGPIEGGSINLDSEINKSDTGINRLAGSNRIDTSLEIAKASFTGKLSNVVLVTADNYPDALTGSVLAYKLNAPILLIGNSAHDQEKVLSYMKSSLEPEGNVYILGGTSAISSAMENKVAAEGLKNITRLSGSDRYDTSVKIADQLDVKTGTPVVLVYGQNYPDALSISSIAAQMQAPILLVGKDGLSQGVEKKISEIMPSRVYIIGGEGVISKDVEERIARTTALTQENIVRLKGSDRYETSLAVAKYFNLSGDKVCIATGSNFPDALSGSVYAGNSNEPIILVNSSLSEEQINYFKTRKIIRATIFGGEGVIGKEIEDELLKLLVSK